MANPKCFISYSWDSDSHRDWVRALATQLESNGVEVHIDQWDVRLGMDLPHYMETSVREADFVLLVCTPAFAQRANRGAGGVGYEKTVVTGEIFSRAAASEKVVPLLRAGNAESSLPSYLKSKVFLDFRIGDFSPTGLEELLRHIYKEPQFIRPARGPRPEFGPVPRAVDASEADKPSSGMLIFCDVCGAVLGNPSTCTISPSHVFVKNALPIYCRVCGAVPGSRSGCTVSTRHFFVAG
jgi:hypothetical protein